MKQKIKKSFPIILLTIFLSIFVLESLLIPAAVRADEAGLVTAAANGPGIPVLVAGDVPGTVTKITDNILKIIKAVLISAGAKAATYALRKVAYDSAVWVASGGKGQGPLAFDKGFGSYLGDVVNESAGTFIQSMSDSAGVNLCKIPDIKIDLALKVGLRTKFSPTQAKPNCTLSQFTKNWTSGEAWSKYTSKEGLMKNFSASITADDSDLGVYLTATEKINTLIAQQKEAAIYNRQEGSGFKPLTTLISDQIKTPVENIKNVAQTLNPQTNFEQSERLLESAISGGDAKVFPAVLGIFLSTLGGTIINNFQTKGILPLVGCVTGSCKNGGSSNGSALNALNNPLFNESSSGLTELGRTAAQNFFNYFTVVKIKESNQYDLLSQLNTCPESPGVYNCRAGDDLSNAIQQSLTIGDAIKMGVLDGEKRLFPPSLTGENNDIKCYQKGYCLNNVKVLRQVRILPLGFEIAIQNSSPQTPWKLKDVVNGFTDCPQNGQNAAGYPYCHLIDPNWVLKAPDARCNALVYTASLLSSDVPTRLQDCVDLQTCVKYTSDGNCDDYAYCTREKNVWKFSSEYCDSQYASCRTFQASNGGNISYLTRTLDSSYCTAANVGCTAYSLSKDQVGNWLNPSFDGPSQSNFGVFLNSKATEETCSSDSAGCSAFTVKTGGETIFLKKAPTYLGCYDADPSSPTVVNWPETEADLTRLSNNSQCNDYSKACIPDEEGCNWYTPKSGGDSIPGKFIPAEVVNNVVDWNDQCDAKCDGYNAYREMPSNYSMGKDIAYIIPSSGRKCAAQDDGCSAFTNLSINTAGSEQVEYFSYLRPCISMEDAKAANVKTFITYEGTKESGFQLRTYLMKYNTTNNSNGVSGSPVYIFKDTAELAYLNAECTEQRYKDGFASLDCRQFNDQNGNIYYRMISHLAPAHEKCTGYRLNEADFYPDTSLNQSSCLSDHGFWDTSVTPAVCQKCVQNGEYRNGGCVYTGIPSGVDSSAGNSRSCLASANTCRAYKGNAGNNVQTVFSENFEGANPINGWSAGQVAAVSTHVGEHSFEYPGSGQFNKTLTLEPGSSYDLTFWATAAQQTNLTVSLNGTNPVTFTAGGAWKQFHIGPMELGGTATSVQLNFNNSANASVFLDNIKLVKVASYLYLVKDSLSVDPICDSNLTDDQPGEALGCTAYTDPQNRTFYLWNFSYLCREDAIGCTAVFDTHNTESKDAAAYRVWIPGAAGQTISRVIGSGTNQTTSTCSVENKPGQNGCYVDILGHSYSEIEAAIPGGFVASSQYLPADSTSTPIYLVADKDSSCSEQDQGCALAGKRVFVSSTWQFVTTTIKNDANNYKNTICESQAAGCDAYAAGTEMFYFKDPILSGQNVCVYKTDTPYSSNGTSTKRISGWFYKDPIGTCSNDPSRFCDKNNVLQDCGYGNACQDTPCYPSSPKYDVYSYGDPSYANFVAECPPGQDTCEEFRDPADISLGQPMPYYLKNNDKLNSGDCNGQVSQKYGCVLLDQINNPTKIWNAAGSYSISNNLDGILVNPSSTSSGADTNRIIKVKQDRECATWLKCLQSYSFFDPAINSFKPICNGNLQLCNQLGTCDVSSADPILNSALYINRSVGWYNLDYDGFSILNMYPIEQLTQINFATSSSSTPDWRLVKYVTCPAGGTNCATIGSGNDFACATNGVECGAATALGTCVNNYCVQTLNGLEGENSEKQICRAYPESDSPFSSSGTVLNSAYFRNANKCDSVSADGSSCECKYQKVSYGDAALTRYWNYYSVGQDRQSTNNWTATDAPSGLCFGGTSGPPNNITRYNGRPCTSDEMCGDLTTRGVCEFQTSKNLLTGWPGFCLERDDTRHINGDSSQNVCLTWYPMEALGGAPDINNQHTEAASDWHSASTALGGYYCVNSSGSNTSKQFSLEFSPGGVNYSGNIGRDEGYGGPVATIFERHCGSKGPFGAWCNWTWRGFAWYFMRSHIDIATSQLGNLGNNTFIDAETGAPIDPTLTTIKKEDIEQVMVQLISSDGIANIASNVSQATLSFPNQNLANPGNNDWPQVNYYVGRIGGTNTGVVAGGFYSNYLGSRDSFLMVYGSYNGGATGGERFAFDPNTGNISENWYGAGLVGDLGASSNRPVYTNSGGSQYDLWSTGVSNSYGGSLSTSNVTDPDSGGLYVLHNDYAVTTTQLIDVNGGVTTVVTTTIVNQYYVDPDSGRPMYVTSSPVYDPDPPTSTRVVVANITSIVPDSDPLQVIGSPIAGTGFCPQRPDPSADFNEWGNIKPWHALRLNFDPVTHEFRSIDTAYCGATAGPVNVAGGVASGSHVYGGGSDKVRYRIILKLRKWCSAYADARINLNDNSPNKVIPWTDRLWNVAQSIFKTVPDIGLTYDSITPAYGTMGSTPLVDNGEPVVLDPNPPTWSCTPRISGGTVVVDCPDTSPVFMVPQYRPGQSYASYPQTITSGLNHLATLFASVSNVYAWVLGPGNISSYPILPNATAYPGLIADINRTEIGDPLNTVIIPRPPEIHPIGAPVPSRSGQTLSSLEPAEMGFSINGITSDVVSLDNRLAASIDFFMFADKNQMPIRQVVIDWDNSPTPAYSIQTGYFRNKRGLVPCTGAGCEPTTLCKYPPDNAPDYGSIQDVTCDNLYYHAANSYSCTSRTDPHYTNVQSSCGNASEFPFGCCIYHPRVQVKDSWGWCNGVCTHNISGTTVRGCYDETWSGNGVTNECDTANVNAWTDFNSGLSRVIVKYLGP